MKTLPATCTGREFRSLPTAPVHEGGAVRVCRSRTKVTFTSIIIYFVTLASNSHFSSPWLAHRFCTSTLLFWWWRGGGDDKRVASYVSGGVCICLCLCLYLCAGACFVSRIVSEQILEELCEFQQSLYDSLGLCCRVLDMPTEVTSSLFKK